MKVLASGPTTPPIVPENPATNEIDIAQVQGNLPTTGEQKMNGLVIFGITFNGGQFYPFHEDERKATIQ